MRSPFLLILSGLLFGAWHIQAQTFEPGLLVRANGDTLRGEVENSFWVEPPAFIRYRRTPGSPSELFKPRQLRAVSFTGGRYFRYEVLPIDHAAKIKLEDLREGLQTDILADSLLAEVLLEGPVSLLRVAGFGPDHYLLRRPGQPVLDLCERSYLRRSPQGSMQVIDGNNYHAHLLRYFGDCPAATRAAEKAAFTAAALVAVVQAYHEACTASRQPARNWLIQAQPRRRVAFQGGVLAGVRYSRYDRATDLSGPGIDTQLQPFAGLYADLFQPSRTVALYGELTASTFRGQASPYSGSDFEYRGWLGTARLGFRFFFPLPHEQQWLFGLGAELNKVFNPTVTSPAAPSMLPDGYLTYAMPTLLPNLGLGWRSQRVTLSLDGQLYIKKSDNPGFGAAFFSENVAGRLGLAYRLGRNPDLTVPHH